MKVVLFCGGLGLRMREVSQRVPKPMIPVGNWPILLHIMKYYAHYGHTEFILCLGYKAHVIKDFFLNGDRALLSDFVFHGGDLSDRERSEIARWKITFVDTGLESNIGQRLMAVREQLGGDELFLANYADVLTDACLPEMIAAVRDSDRVATFLCVKPTYSFHVVSFRGRRAGEAPDDTVYDIQPVMESDVWINGGYFVLRREIFDYMQPGDELVEAPFRRLIADGKLLAHRYRGFWAPMDTLKDRQNLDFLHDSGQRPWAVWEKTETATPLAAPAGAAP